MTPRPLSQKSSPVVVNSILTEKQPHTVPSLLYCNGSKNVSSMNILQWKTASWEASGLDYGLFIVVKRQFVALPRAVPHNASCKYTHTRQQAGLLQSLLMQWRRERSLSSALYRKIIKNYHSSIWGHIYLKTHGQICSKNRPSFYYRLWRCVDTVWKCLMLFQSWQIEHTV